MGTIDPIDVEDRSTPTFVASPVGGTTCNDARRLAACKRQMWHLQCPPAPLTHGCRSESEHKRLCKRNFAPHNSSRERDEVMSACSPIAVTTVVSKCEIFSVEACNTRVGCRRCNRCSRMQRSKLMAALRRLSLCNRRWEQYAVEFKRQ